MTAETESRARAGAGRGLILGKLWSLQCWGRQAEPLGGICRPPRFLKDRKGGASGARLARMGGCAAAGTRCLQCGAGLAGTARAGAEAAPHTKRRGLEGGSTGPAAAAGGAEAGQGAAFPNGGGTSILGADAPARGRRAAAAGVRSGSPAGAQTECPARRGGTSPLVPSRRPELRGGRGGEAGAACGTRRPQEPARRIPASSAGSGWGGAPRTDSPGPYTSPGLAAEGPPPFASDLVLPNPAPYPTPAAVSLRIQVS